MVGFFWSRRSTVAAGLTGLHPFDRLFRGRWREVFNTDPDGGRIHGLNERIHVRSVYEGRTFLYRLVKLYASQ